MTIDEYLVEKGVRPSELARLVGISVTYLWMIRESRYVPRKLVAESIERHTGGMVTAQEILNIKVVE